jgi:hypothetical protein
MRSTLNYEIVVCVFRVFILFFSIFLIEDVRRLLYISLSSVDSSVVFNVLLYLFNFFAARNAITWYDNIGYVVHRLLIQVVSNELRITVRAQHSYITEYAGKCDISLKGQVVASDISFLRLRVASRSTKLLNTSRRLQLWRRLLSSTASAAMEKTAIRLSSKYLWRASFPCRCSYFVLLVSVP